MTVDQALWEDELARAVTDLDNAVLYDDQGMVEWHKERIRWAKMKIKEYTEYEESKKKGA